MGGGCKKLKRQLSVFLVLTVLVTAMYPGSMLCAAEPDQTAMENPRESTGFYGEEAELVPPASGSFEDTVSESIVGSEEISENSTEKDTGNGIQDAGAGEEAEPLPETQSPEGQTPESETVTVGSNEPDADGSNMNQTTGVTISDIEVSPGSCDAVFTFSVNGTDDLRLQPLYTTDNTDLTAFSPDESEVSIETVQSSGCRLGILDEISHEDNAGSRRYTARFLGYGHVNLTADTTYYYRLGYLIDKTTYRFLSGTGQFTTKPVVEETAVKIESLSVDRVGYHTAEVKLIIDNPEDERIAEGPYLYVAPQGQEFSETKYEGAVYVDQNGNQVPNVYTFTISALENPCIAKAQLKVPVGAEAVLETIESETITLQCEDLKNAEFIVEATADAATIQVNIMVQPWLHEKDVLRVFLCTRPEGSGEWQVIQGETGQDGTAKLTAGNLDQDYRHEYYVCAGNNQEDMAAIYGSREKPFVNVPSVTYDDTVFPDPVFRELVKSKIKSDKITSFELEKIKEIYHSGSESAGYIASMEGIQYLSGLTSVGFSNEKLTDADGISTLNNLTSVSISKCELTDLPDMSKLSGLDSALFSYNKIVPSSISADKLPRAFLEKNKTWIADTKANQYVKHNVPSEADIQSRSQELTWSRDVVNTYVQEPETTSPYAPGQLSDTSLDNALHLVNVIRYTAGVPSDVTLDDAYTEYAQAASLICSLNGEISHYPKQPQGVPEALYQAGYKGASSSNLALGPSELAGSVFAWMDDNDASNIDRIGHRRWILDPRMKKTGFGAVGSCAAMYAIDGSGDTKISDFVAWPAQNTPVEFMSMRYGYPWSVGLGKDYAVKDESKVTVTLKQSGTNNIWLFDKNASDFNNNYFNISKEMYGGMDCIIFRPAEDSISCQPGSEFEVSVTGLVNRFGEEAEIHYTVRFFSLGGQYLPSIKLDKTEIKMQVGETATITASVQNGGAQDYKHVWTSSDPRIVSVDGWGYIRAEAVGEAVITVTSESGLHASCHVTVEGTAEEDTVQIPENLHALTNVQTTLKDVAFENEGWAWTYPDTPLSQFAGMQEKQFPAIYSRPDHADYEASVPLALSTLTGIAVRGDNTAMRVGDSRTVGIDWLVTGAPVTDSLMAGYIKNVTWSSTNETVASVKADTGFQAKLTAAADGKAVVKAEMVLNGNQFSAQYEVSVSGTDIVTVASGFTWDEDKQGYVGPLESAGERYLYISAGSGVKWKAVSTNKNVLVAGKPETTGTNTRLPLTAKAAGTAKITVTAEDAAGTSKDIWFYITDPKPCIDTGIVTVNKLKTAGEPLGIAANEGYILSDITTDAGFSITKDRAGCWMIKADSSTKKGTYKLALTITVKDVSDAGWSYRYLKKPAITVKVVEQRPSFQVKQSAKANVFYKNLGAPYIKVTSSETVEKMELTDCDFRLDAQNMIVAASTDKTAASLDKKGVLKITFAGYTAPVEMDFTVGAVRKVPGFTLGSKTVTLYPWAGIDSAGTDIKLAGQRLALDNITVDFANKKYDYLLTKDSDKNMLRFSGNGAAFTPNETIKEKIILRCSDWTEEVKLPYTIKVRTGKPAVKLQKNTLKINKAPEFASYDTAFTEVLWKDGTYPDLSTVTVSVIPADNKAAAIYQKGISFQSIDNGVSAVLTGQDLAAGTYKFRVQAAAGTAEVTAPLTVKVVDVSSDKAVKVTAKGKLDVLDRKGTFLTLTPSLKSVNGSVVDAALEGRDAHLFRTFCQGGKVYLYAKENAALITKYNYAVRLKLTLENVQGGEICVTTSEIKFPLKQGKPKMAVTPKKGTFYSGAYNQINLRFVSSLKGADAPEIAGIALQNNTDVFAYDSDTSTLTLLRTGNAVKGKTYNLRFQIMLRDQADNEKPIIVNYSARVL